jgi:hypothetical protein
MLGLGTARAPHGDPLGTIPGADFARVDFGMGLGPQPIDASFRERLFQTPGMPNALAP